MILTGVQAAVGAGYSDCVQRDAAAERTQSARISGLERFGQTCLPLPSRDRLAASGEPPLCMAANVLFAVKGAIQNALGEIGQSGNYFALSLRARAVASC